MRVPITLLVILAFTAPALRAQDPARDSLRLQRDSLAQRRDSLDERFVQRVERHTDSPKVYHAEPIYIDLMRDLGARKGEAEWNVGFGMTDHLRYDEYLLFAEYEWAPRDRFGLEIEFPFRLHSALERGTSTPPNQLESVKLAGMWTAAVDTVRHWSTALGYLHEVLLTDSWTLLRRRPVDGHLFNPFVVTARRWGTNWHTMLYAGPRLVRRRDGRWEAPVTEANWSTHYMIPGTRNFAGLEVNQSIARGRNDFVFRPQLRLAINDHMLLGIATGVPLRRESERMGLFLRLIYEPRSGNPREHNGG